MENYCPNMVLTYAGEYYDGTTTYGGYSNEMVANQQYVVRIPDYLPLDASVPLLCAGVTVYSALRYFELDQGDKHVGVVGFGGLGHLAIKFAKAFGLKVSVISSSPSKCKEALECFGAHSFLNSHDQDQIQNTMGTMDGIIDTVSADHSMVPLLGLLKSHGKLIVVGVPEKPLEVPIFNLLAGRKMITGSGIGGMKETQEMMDFAAKHDIKANVEVIPMNYVNIAMDRLSKGDVRY
ncbi:putative mannitol dehydrogenase, partial [Bienertia sinuspersici]